MSRSRARVARGLLIVALVAARGAMGVSRAGDASA